MTAPTSAVPGFGGVTADPGYRMTNGWKQVAPPGRATAYSGRAYWSITCSSTLAPAATCSGEAYSISLWLIPSLQGIKIIPVGAR